MKSTVYIETSIPSFYYETRQEPEFVAMRSWTREWWEEARTRYLCFTSDAVISELEQGEHPKKTKKLYLVTELEQLEINRSIEEIWKSAYRTISCRRITWVMRFTLRSHRFTRWIFF